MYKVFYNIVRLGDVPAENAQDVDLAEVYLNIFPLLKEHREYFGLVDQNETTLQAMYDEDTDQFWFEVPSPEKRGSFGANLSFEAAMALIKSLDGPFPREGFEGFEFQAWE